jgi:hypothetical protein
MVVLLAVQTNKCYNLQTFIWFCQTKFCFTNKYWFRGHQFQTKPNECIGYPHLVTYNPLHLFDKQIFCLWFRLTTISNGGKEIEKRWLDTGPRPDNRAPSTAGRQCPGEEEDGQDERRVCQVRIAWQGPMLAYTTGAKVSSVTRCKERSAPLNSSSCRGMVDFG